jgi:hypothetical protein
MADMAMLFRRRAGVASSVKLGGGCVNSPSGQRDLEALHGGQGFGDAISRALEVSFGEGDSGIRFPRQRLPSALGGRQRDPEKSRCLVPRCSLVPLCKPEFCQSRLEQHAGVPVKKIACGWT